MVKFLRRSVDRYSKLGKKRKNKQKWKRPTGRDNKMREKRRGYPATVSIGYKTNSKTRAKLKEKKPIIIKNVKDLNKIEEETIGILGKVGKKKKLEIVTKAEEMKIPLYNVNIKTFLRKNKLKKESKPKSIKNKPEEISETKDKPEGDKK